MSKKSESSQILEDIILLVYPMILLFGMYVVLTGYRNPGGGFQGGAIVAAVFMCRYLVYPQTMRGLDFLKKLDKTILIFILAFASFFILTLLQGPLREVAVFYNIVMNILIGIKVTAGLTIVFFTFMEIEGGQEN